MPNWRDKPASPLLDGHNPLCAGIVRAWAFTDGYGAKARDLVSGQVATWAGAAGSDPWIKDGPTGRAINLASAFTAADSALPMGAGPRSVAFFFRTTLNTAYRSFFHYGSTNTGQSIFAYLNNGKLACDTYLTAFDGTTLVNDGTWRSGGFSFGGGSAGTTTNLYANGVLDGTGTQVLNTIASGTLYIGTDALARPIVGDLDWLVVWNRFLSADEHKSFYDNPSALLAQSRAVRLFGAFVQAPAATPARGLILAPPPAPLRRRRLVLGPPAARLAPTVLPPARRPFPSAPAARRSPAAPAISRASTLAGTPAAVARPRPPRVRPAAFRPGQAAALVAPRRAANLTSPVPPRGLIVRLPRPRIDD